MGFVLKPHCPPCNKTIFTTEALAKFELAKLERRKKDPSRQESRAYECPFGNGWHTSSKPVWVAAPERGPDAGVSA